MEEKLAWIWLSLLFPAGSSKPKHIQKELGSPVCFLQMTREERRKLGFLTRENLDAAEHVSPARAEFVAGDCQKKGISIVSFADPEYPERLRSIYGPPAVLYVLGNISGLDEEVVITMVGTRHETEYSNSVTGWLAKGMAEAGAVIVSGCAVGCDTSALVGALQGGGRAIGVLGCGLDVDYPHENRRLKRQLLRQGGALISELPPGAPVRGKYFPTRNRIMAGLSVGTVVTQAPERSGALLTADHALENGRDVFCVPPYSIFDPAYYGVIEYLRQGAIPVFCPDDVIGQYAQKFPDKLDTAKITGDYVKQKRADGKQERISVPRPASQSQPKEETLDRGETDRKNEEILATLDEVQRLVYTNLDMAPSYVNELVERTGLSVGKVLSILTELEIEGVAKSLGGSRYMISYRDS